MPAGQVLLSSVSLSTSATNMHLSSWWLLLGSLISSHAQRGTFGCLGHWSKRNAGESQVFGAQEASPAGSSYPPEVDGNFENPLFQEDCVYPPTSCSTAADFIKEGRGGSLPLAPASQPALCSHWIVQPLACQHTTGRKASRRPSG